VTDAMKVAILHFQSVTSPLAGDTAYLANLSRGLTEAGHQVALLSLFPPPRGQSLWQSRVRRAAYSAFMFSQASRLGDCDIALFAEPLSPMNVLILRYLELRTDVPIVLGLVGCLETRSRPSHLLLGKRFPAMIISEVARRFAETISTSVGLVTPGLDIQALRPRPAEKEWDLLYVGHLFREKGVFLLLRAMNWLKERGQPLKLRIISSRCAEEERYRRCIRENGLERWVDMETVVITDQASAYCGARVFVYPGVSHNRVCMVPMTILEASACGLPVVCTSLYSHIDLPNITFVDPTPEAMGRAMLRAVSRPQPDECDRAVAVIRERHSLSTMGKMAESFFAEIVGAR